MTANHETAGKAPEATLLRHAAALHHLHSQLVWQRRRQSRGSTGKAIVHVVLRPLTRLVRAWQATRTYGPAVARAAHISLWRQFLQQWWIAVRFDFTCDSYYRYRLYRLDRMGEAILFFPLNVHMALRGHLYEHLDVDVAQLEDKRNFHRRCAVHDLPVPTTLAEFTQGSVRGWPDGGECVALPACDLFSKPADALEGKGVARWIWQESGHYRGVSGPALTAAELLAHLAACSRSGPHILQKRLANHPAIAALGPKALCTARIVTCRDADGPPEHLVSIFRMPAATATAEADNFAAGGFASPVDPATGALGHAVRKDLRDAAVDYREYPGSTQPFTGFRLPHWNTALNLCLQAHRVFHEFPSVGWDVAITPDGPVLVEGNHDWDAVLAQQPGCRALGRTRLVASYLSFLRLTNNDDNGDATT